MKRLIKKFKRANKVARFTYLFCLIGYLLSFSFFTKSIISLTGIETVIRYLILLLFLSYFFFYAYNALYKILAKKYTKFYLLSVLTIIFIVIFSFSAYFIDLVYNKISGVNENEKALYTSYLISLNETSLNAKSSLGMISDEDDVEGNILAKEIIKKHDLDYDVEKYDDYYALLYALYEKEVDAIFVSSNYVTLFSSEEAFQTIGDDTKVLYQTSKEMKNADALLTSNKSLTEPFTVLIMGVDSEYDNLNANAAFNGDTLMLATFNPHTLTATLLSIPRDTYVPIACRNNSYAKINSSAAYGTSCVIDTVEKFTDIQIDYYVKINFKGVVALVDAVGGVEVEVEQPDYAYNHGVYCKGMVCEQNSDRMWGNKTIYIEPGLQTLNGEEALAYARCRGLYASSDLARNRHQQDIIMALGKKMMNINSYGDFKDILDAVINNIATNMTTSQILSSYQIFKEMLRNILNEEDFISVQKTSLETYTLPVYIASSNRTTSALGYYENSLEDIIKTMKINLELTDAEMIKTFSYSLNENYEETVAGKGLRSGSSMTVLQSFIKSEKAEAEKYCQNNKLNCSFKYVDENSEYYDKSIDTDLIAYQLPHAGTLLEDVDDLTFYINGQSIYESEID